MAKNSVRTSKTVASKASRELRSGKTSKTTKQLAASALSNRRKKWPPNLAPVRVSCPGGFSRTIPLHALSLSAPGGDLGDVSNINAKALHAMREEIQKYQK